MAEADKSEKRSTRSAKRTATQESGEASPEKKRRSASSPAAETDTSQDDAATKQARVTMSKKKSDAVTEEIQTTGEATHEEPVAAASPKPLAVVTPPPISSATSQGETPAANEEPKEADVGDNSLLPAQRGKAGQFGGPKDRSVRPDDKLALPTGKHFTYERVRSLNPKGFYCAMRWNLKLAHKSPEESRRWWANKKIHVTHKNTGKSVIVRAVEVGPHENSGLDILLSPGALEALGLEIGQEVEIAFADQKLPTGIVN